MVTALTHSERANNDRVYVPKRPRVSRAGWPAGRALESDGAGSRVRSSWLATVLAGLVLALLGFVPTADASVAAAVPINSYDQAGYIYDGPPHTYDRLDHVALAHGIATAAVPLAPDVPAAPNPASFRAVAANTDTLLSAGGGSARLPMNMGTVNGVASKYGIQVDDLVIRIDKAKAGIRGSTAPNGCIKLCRGAFESEEQLAKTLVHERVHVEDLRGGMPYPRGYDAQSAAEVRAETVANDWWSGR